MENNNLRVEVPFDYVVYAIYDRVAGRYGEPFLLNRQELAVRRFDYLMANSPMVANDCELYDLGVFDMSTGYICPREKPVFVVKYDFKRSERYMSNG